MKRKTIFIVLAAFFLIGAARASLSRPVYVPEARYEVRGIVYEVPDSENGNYTLCSVTLGGEELDGKLRLRILGSDKPQVGDEVSFSGTVKTTKVYFGSYNERLELLSKGVTAKADCESFETLSTGHIPVKRCLSFTRAYLDSRIHDVFGDNAGIVSAFLLGNKSNVDEADMDAFRQTGTAHLLALSGFHVGIFAALVFLLIPKRFPKVRLIVVGLFLLFYCAVASFTASIVRASIMSMCILLSDAAEKRRDPLSALALSALIILAVSPYMLYAVGFRLSFSATLGIILITSAGTGFADKPVLNKIVSTVLVSLGATVATSLISARYFNTFPTYGLLANIVAVPLFSVIITMCFIIVPISIFFPGAASVLAWVPNTMTDGAMYALDGIRSLPYSTIDVAAPSDLSCVLILFLMFTISAYVLRPLKKRVHIFLLVLLLFTASLVADIIRA